MHAAHKQRGSPSPHLIERRAIGEERKQRLFEDLFSIPISNAKWARQNLHLDFDELCVQFVRAMVRRSLADPSSALQRFLEKNPWPQQLSDLTLSEEERASFIIMNALKVWVSKEQAYMDTLFTGGQFRKRLRSMAAGRKCPKCNTPLLKESTQFHHAVRDGRPPLPIGKDCHGILENQRKAVESTGTAEEAQVSGIVRTIRRKHRASWVNLLKAVRSLRGLPHEPFGTDNVKATSKSIVRHMQRETGLDLSRLQELLEALGAE
jgi:hypothetical protein